MKVCSGKFATRCTSHSRPRPSINTPGSPSEIGGRKYAGIPAGTTRRTTTGTPSGRSFVPIRYEVVKLGSNTLDPRSRPAGILATAGVNVTIIASGVGCRLSTSSNSATRCRTCSEEEISPRNTASISPRSVSTGSSAGARRVRERVAASARRRAPSGSNSSSSSDFPLRSTSAWPTVPATPGPDAPSNDETASRADRPIEKDSSSRCLQYFAPFERKTCLGFDSTPAEPGSSSEPRKR